MVLWGDVQYGPNNSWNILEERRKKIVSIIITDLLRNLDVLDWFAIFGLVCTAHLAHTCMHRVFFLNSIFIYLYMYLDISMKKTQVSL